MIRRMMKILLIEDNLEHAKLIELILRRKNIQAHVSVVRDGTEALELFRRISGSSSVSKNLRPDLILLDLNTPRLDGRELLHRVKSTKSLKDIPVVVVSTSNRPEDLQFARREGATQYISKSSSFEEWSEMLGRVHELASLKKQKFP